MNPVEKALFERERARKLSEDARVNLLTLTKSVEKQATEKRELREALQSFVNCIETLKANGFQTDWFDCAWINQELKRAKKALGEKG